MNDAVPLMSARSQPSIPELPFSPILPDTSRSDETTSASASVVFSSDRAGSDGYLQHQTNNNNNIDNTVSQDQQEDPIGTWQPQQETRQPVASYDNGNDIVDSVSGYSQQRRDSNDTYGSSYNNNFNGGAVTQNATNYDDSITNNSTYQADGDEQPSTVYHEEPAIVSSSQPQTEGGGIEISNAPPPFFNPGQVAGVSNTTSFSKFGFFCVCTVYHFLLLLFLLYCTLLKL